MKLSSKFDVRQAHGGIDYVIANAGILLTQASLHQVKIEEYEEFHRVNVLAVLVNFVFS